MSEAWRSHNAIDADMVPYLGHPSAFIGVYRRLNSEPAGTTDGVVIGDPSEVGNRRTEAIIGNTVVKTTILYACSTESAEGTGRTLPCARLCLLRGLCG